MYSYLKPLVITLLLLGFGYALLPLVAANPAEAKTLLITLKKYCLSHPWTGYMIYAGTLSVILFAGLPMATLAILLSGVIYGFWEAVTIVTLSRLLTAMAVFFIMRHMLHVTGRPVPRAPYLIRKFQNHPKIGLVLARLAPLPDSVVNYTVAAAPISHREYILCSLVGMIPFTLVCVWMGNELGTVSHLIRWIQ